MELSETIVLSPADQERLVKALLAPPEASAALRSAMARHDQLVSETFARESDGVHLGPGEPADGS
ncbi:type II toxin -antitoxin system TacA 1-like antitoxin [Burkholderia thailandensis]